jgi:hypothetical protein
MPSTNQILNLEPSDGDGNTDDTDEADENGS